MPASSPLVSVVIPAYGHAAFLPATLESVFAQTCTDYEIIVINDGSPDHTEDVLRPYAESGRIRYIAQENTGQGGARNRGITEARGQFISLLDDDDLMPPDKLQWQVEALQSNPQATLVYGYADPMDITGTPTTPRDAYGNPLDWPRTGPTGPAYAAFAQRCWIVSPGQTLIRRDHLPSLPFDTALRGCDDWDLYLRLAERHPFLFVEHPALHYRFHGGNASKDTLALRRTEFRLLRKHLRRNTLHPTRGLAIARTLVHYLRITPPWLIEQARQDLANGLTEQAHQKLDYALRLRPYLALRPYFQRLRG